MPRSALCCALAASATAALAVAEQRVGLALSVALLLALAAGILARRAAGERVAWLPVALAGALALQPLLRDAGWVVGACVAASLLAGTAAVAPVHAWSGLPAVLLAPLRVVAGTTLALRATHALLPPTAEVRARHGLPVVRGVVAAVVVLLAFGGLFAAADPAFADVADGLFTVDVDPSGAIWRGCLGLLVLGGAGALVRAATRGSAGEPSTARWVPRARSSPSSWRR